ncbi:MAG: hypothetical protein L6W00_06965 [Lentisphaeria bacterium]|nr:MAG: hypothetical protein L6W00_06965 [Lentisphaeria bacterium]
MRISINPVQTSHGRKRSGGRPALQPHDRKTRRGSLHISPRSRPRTTEVGISRLGTVFSHRRGLEGDRPSSSHDRKTRRGSLHISPAPGRAPQKSEFPASALSSPIEEV